MTAHRPSISMQPMDSSPAPALDRGLLILRLLARQPDGAAFSELQACFGWSKMSLSRLLQVLAHHRCISKCPQSGRYFLTGDAPAHGPPTLLHRAEAGSCLGELSRALQATVILVARDGSGMRTLAKERLPGGPTMRPVGSITYTWFAHPWCLPVALAMHEDERQRLIRRERPSQRQLAALQDARRQLADSGCCGDDTATCRRVAAPIRAPDGAIIGAVAAAAESDTFDTERGLPRCCWLLRQAADDITGRIDPPR